MTTEQRATKPPTNHWGRTILLLVVLVAMACIFADAFRFFARYQQYRTLADTPLPPIDDVPEVIAVLTGDSGRIPKAVELLKQRPAARLIVSGTAKGITLTELMNQQGPAKGAGEVWSRIEIESKSESTTENALVVSQMIRSGEGRILLVTSDYHMDRALALFQRALTNAKLNVELIPISVKSRAGYWKPFTEYLKNACFHYLPW